MTLHAHKLIEALENGPINTTYNCTRNDKIQHAAGAGDEDITTVNDWHGHLAKLIRRAGKFFIGLPNETEEMPSALVATGIEYMAAGLYQPPFPVTYFEYCIPRDDPDNNRSLPHALLVVDNKIHGYTAVIPITYHDKAGWIDVGSWVYAHIVKMDTPMKYGRLWDDLNRWMSREFLQDTLTIAGNIYAGTLALLDAKGCETEVEPAPERLNKRRAKKGRPPIYEHRVVKIGGISRGGGVIGVGGTRASPRTHWRRGHIRTLASGKRTPIPATLIAKGNRGFISHDYEVEQKEDENADATSTAAGLGDVPPTHEPGGNRERHRLPTTEKAAIMASRRQPPRRPARKGRKVDPDTVITEGHNLCHR
jgi:hypothetical protein